MPTFNFANKALKAPSIGTVKISQNGAPANSPTIFRVRTVYPGRTGSDQIVASGSIVIEATKKIKSLTVYPFFKILGVPNPPTLRFDFGFLLAGNGGTNSQSYVTMADGFDPTVPVNVPLGKVPPKQVTLSITSDQGDDLYWQTYLASNPTRPLSFLYGISLGKVVTT